MGFPTLLSPPQECVQEATAAVPALGEPSPFATQLE